MKELIGISVFIMCALLFIILAIGGVIVIIYLVRMLKEEIEEWREANEKD